MNRLSIVIPCYNEEATLRKCVEKVLDIQDDELFESPAAKPCQVAVRADIVTGARERVEGLFKKRP